VYTPRQRRKREGSKEVGNLFCILQHFEMPSFGDRLEQHGPTLDFGRDDDDEHCELFWMGIFIILVLALVIGVVANNMGLI